LQTECEKCGHIYDAKQSSYGAAHAAKWRRLPKLVYQAMKIWLMDDDMRNSVFTHMELYEALTKRGLRTSVSSFNEQRSGMLNPKIGLIHSSKQRIIPHEYHIISVISNRKYWLNIPRAKELMINGGRLESD